MWGGDTRVGPAGARMKAGRSHWARMMVAEADSGYSWKIMPVGFACEPEEW